MPVISVIVPVYNVECYLHRCVQSVLAQSYSDWELLLINDGSNDDSGIICDTYSQQDKRIKYFLKPNGGVSSARNLGLIHALGDWVMFLDSDDWLDPECLNVCLNEVTCNDLDLVQFNHTLVYENGRTFIKQRCSTDILSPDQYLDNGIFNVCAGGGLYKHSIIKNQSIEFPLNLKLAEDQIFILSVIKNASRVRYLDSAMYYYYQNDNSAVHNKRSMDMLNSCNELIKFASTWAPAKKFTDSMCLVLILDIISNRDIDLKIIYDLYKRVNFAPAVLKHLPSSCYIFKEVAKISPLFAIRFMSFYFSLRHNFKKA